MKSRGFKSAGRSMQVRRMWTVLLLMAAFLGSGCKSLFPTAQTRVASPWNSYAQAQAAFDKIAVLQTTTRELKNFGFDPDAPNVKVLTYLDVIQRFIPNQSITKEDLETSVRDCIEAKGGCRAFELVIDQTKGKREGNLMLDVLGFKRNTHETGWRFSALLLIRNDMVVYKLASGTPAVDRYDRRLKPLGPLQELDSMVLRVVPGGR